MKTTQVKPLRPSQPWQESDQRALIGASIAAAAMAVTAKKLGIVVIPAVQRIYGPILNPSFRWEPGYQLQSGVPALDSASEDAVKAAGRLGLANAEVEFDGLTSEQILTRMNASGDWCLDTINRGRDESASDTDDAYLAALCARDLITQALQLHNHECRIVTLSPESVKAFEA